MLAPRKHILTLNSCFSEHLIKAQRAKRQPSWEWRAGQEAYIDGLEQTLTSAQADALNAEDMHAFLDGCDEYTLQDGHTWIGRASLAAPQQAAVEYLDNIGRTLARLVTTMGPLLVMGDWGIPWLSQPNDYPPVTRASRFLTRKIAPDFCGEKMSQRSSATCSGSSAAT